MSRRGFAVLLVFLVFYGSCIFSTKAIPGETQFLSRTGASKMKDKAGNDTEPQLQPRTIFAPCKQGSSKCMFGAGSAQTPICNKASCNAPGSTRATPCRYPYEGNSSKHNGVAPPSCQGDFCCLDCGQWEDYLVPSIPQCTQTKFEAGECFSPKCFECKPYTGMPSICDKPVLGYGFLCSGDYQNPTACCVPNGYACNLVPDDGVTVLNNVSDRDIITTHRLRGPN